MHRLFRIAAGTLTIAWSASSCAHQTEIAIPPGDLRAGTGELRVDVREDTRLTEGVRGAVVELAAEPGDNWLTPLRHTAADTTGTVTIGNLAPARYEIRVWAAGHDTVTQHVRVKAGEIEAVRVALRDDRCKVIVTSHGPVCT